VDPFTIYFTHHAISKRFRTGQLIDDVIQDILEGRTSVEDFPQLEVTLRAGKLYSISNRRLFVFRVLAALGFTRLAKVKICLPSCRKLQRQIWDWKLSKWSSKWESAFSTLTGGLAVEVPSRFAHLHAKLRTSRIATTVMCADDHASTTDILQDTIVPVRKYEDDRAWPSTDLVEIHSLTRGNKQEAVTIGRHHSRQSCDSACDASQTTAGEETSLSSMSLSMSTPASPTASQEPAPWEKLTGTPLDQLGDFVATSAWPLEGWEDRALHVDVGTLIFVTRVEHGWSHAVNTAGEAGWLPSSFCERQVYIAQAAHDVEPGKGYLRVGSGDKLHVHYREKPWLYGANCDRDAAGWFPVSVIDIAFWDIAGFSSA